MKRFWYMSSLLHVAILAILFTSLFSPLQEPIHWKSTSYSVSALSAIMVNLVNASTLIKQTNDVKPVIEKDKLADSRKIQKKTSPKNPAKEVNVAEKIAKQHSHLKTQPALLAKTPPPLPYPEQARVNKQDGSVLLRAEINQQGKVFSVNVVTSSGYSLLDQAALAWFKTLVFTPAVKNNQPIVSQMTQKITFKLVADNE